MLNHQRGKAGEAYRLITAALKVQPRSPDALSNLALVLHALKRSDEALAQPRQGAGARARPSRGAQQSRQRAARSQAAGRGASRPSTPCWRQAPRHVQALINRGNARAGDGRGRAGARRLRRGARRRAGPSARALQPRQCAARARPRAGGARGLRRRARGRAEPCQRLDQPRHGAGGAQPPPGCARELRPGARARAGQRRRAFQRRAVAADGRRLSRAALPNTSGAGSAPAWARARISAAAVARRNSARRQDHPAARRAGPRRHRDVRALRAAARARRRPGRAGGAAGAQRPAGRARRRRRDCRARRAAAAVRCALPADQPAARLQDRALQRAGGHSLSARLASRKSRNGGRACDALPRRASRWPGPAAPPMSTTATARSSLAQLEPLLSAPGRELRQHPARAARRPTPNCWRASRASRISATSLPTSPTPRRCWRSPIS